MDERLETYDEAMAQWEAERESLGRWAEWFRPNPIFYRWRDMVRAQWWPPGVSRD